MKILNFFSAVFLVFTLAFWYSCTKENVTKDVVSNDLETELREDPPCENAIGNCPFTNPWKKDTLTGVIIDLYPGCTFYVIYEYKECTPPPDYITKFDVRIVLYGYWPICAAFEADYVINPFVISQVSK
ncbi:MAG: hypothetical protein LC107_12040, partial [Chitinophagales bacterium]|nr:hypothetical protein [Chitinophagales bacterium]